MQLHLSAAYRMPLAVSLPPMSKRCIHEDIPKDSEGTVELFVEKGGKLEVHLTLEGPMSTGWGGVPERSDQTEILLDELVTNGQETDFDDSYLFSFKSKGGPYQVCVANDMNHLAAKLVQLDLRSSSTPHMNDPRLAIDSPPTSKEDKAKRQDILNLESSIRRLKSGLKKVQKQQEQERHRQAVHTSVNEENNNHMVIGSLIETVVFIAAASFQIVFVRNWFENKKTKSRQWA